MKKISLIITTYNWPTALQCILDALRQQTDHHFEVLIADDGSKADTQAFIQQYKQKTAYPILHVRQDDDGFRAAVIRNKAAVQARGDYLIFLDGDCIPDSHFIARHRQLAEPGYFVAGNRVLLADSFSQQVIREAIDLTRRNVLFWFNARVKKHCNRFLPVLYWPFNFLRKIHRRQWKGAKTCNLAIWKNDFMAINGLDESFVGWGHEDADLVVRLIRYGVRRKSGRCAVPVFHLYHPEASRQHEKENLNRLLATLQSDHVQAKQGVNQYFNSNEV